MICLNQKIKPNTKYKKLNDILKGEQSMVYLDVDRLFFFLIESNDQSNNFTRYKTLIKMNEEL